MKDKLEPNMYVRLVNDVEDIVVINKIANVFETTILTENDGSIYQGEYTKENVVKASYNIIDLIEKNDYINGSWVNKIVDGKPIHEDYNDPFYSFGWENEDIKTVITHEQMEQMEYKVEE